MLKNTEYYLDNTNTRYTKNAAFQNGAQAVCATVPGISSEYVCTNITGSDQCVETLNNTHFCEPGCLPKP